MARKIKFGKIAIVIFLTVLIWVWADLAQEKDFTIPSVTIRAPESVKTLLVNFTQNESFVYAVSVENVVVRGPAKKIAEIEQMLNKGKLELDFFLRPEEQGITEPGERPLNVLNFLKQSERIRSLGLTVEACEPQNLIVNVDRLVKKTLTVQCLDEKGFPLKASTEPATVDAYVLADQTPAAKVLLMPNEIAQARRSAIKKTPYVELPGGQTRDALAAVQIKMPPAEDALPELSIRGAKPGIALSLNLLGIYKVEVENLSEVIGTIRIRATAEAKQAYENMRYQVILEIDDKDTESKEPLRREVVYNFPQEFVQRDEIVLNQPRVVARFKLVPISAEEP
jgi:hypothetical protein